MFCQIIFLDYIAECSFSDILIFAIHIYNDVDDIKLAVILISSIVFDLWMTSQHTFGIF
jgi:hypothetical protein